MSKRTYTASLSRSQGRPGFSIIFRHPVRQVGATGQQGLRVRRGLDTQDQVEAERLRDELNVLLRDTKFHDPASRATAEGRFDARIVDIFYDQMIPEERDFVGVREEVIPMPESGPDGYRRVLFLGTTGAGKTTLVRQLIGTDPDDERFPSTSTAKTTIHDTEIVLDDGDWRAVVTFAPSDEVREHLNECISTAILAAARDADDSEVLRHLLNHVNQRFRFNYVLGNGPTRTEPTLDFDWADDEEDELSDEPVEVEEDGEIDVTRTGQLLARIVANVRELGRSLREEVNEALGGLDGADDERTATEIFEENLDDLLRRNDEFHRIADELMDEIEERFELLPANGLRKTRQGWPLSWRGAWPAEQRGEFVQTISRFSSNYSPHFGRLLTPLVNGVRVAGPFSPAWDEGPTPKLVLLDGEGLGHTTNSSSAVSTSVSRRIDAADAVVLVDNATQPMQAAPLTVIREVIVTGHDRKLILAFTHFDEVRGDNLPDQRARKNHVRSSAENVLAAFRKELGTVAERSLGERLKRSCFFLASLHEPLNDESSRPTIRALSKLLGAIDATVEPLPIEEGRPVYERMNLVLPIQRAVRRFHDAWRPRLGLEPTSSVPKEHWARVKALSRRIAEGWRDEYDTLTPVADLRKELVERIYLCIQNPVRWKGVEPSDDGKKICFDALSKNLASRLLELCKRRLLQEHATDWGRAHGLRGTGSTFVRARIIGDEIYEPAAPVPDVTPSPHTNQFLRDVVGEVEEAAKETGAVLE